MIDQDEDKLSREEIERYARHIILREIGGPGQQKLKKTRVLVVGAGGLGASILIHLASAGIGTLGIIDDDIVSLSNLQRQIIHGTDTIGTSKVSSARATLLRINPHVKIEEHNFRLTKDNVADLIARYDLVIDGSDNFTTRYLVADFTESLKIPLITGAISRFDGSVTVLKPFENNNPSYRDIFPTQPPMGTIQSCAQAGVISALPGVIGSIQAMEAIKLITGIGECLIGRLMLYDSLNTRFDVINYTRR